jgi:DNA repair protein RadC
MTDSSSSALDHAQRQGHRARLLDRFADHGLAPFHDYEILELLLTYAIARRDTKALAKTLLSRYKTISGLLNADPAKLARETGLSRRAALLLSLLREIGALCLREKYEQRSVLLHRGDVDEYLRFHFGLRPDEYVAALFMDTANHVRGTEIIAEGTVNQCVIYPRQVFEKALARRAASVIIAHNHPGGTSTPSPADWNITKRLHEIGKLLEVPLLDHIIIVQDKVISLREHAMWPG